MGDDGYYAEIEIIIDGWRWNLSDQPGDAPEGFPLAERLMLAWELEEPLPRRRRPRAA